MIHSFPDRLLRNFEFILNNIQICSKKKKLKKKSKNTDFLFFDDSSKFRASNLILSGLTSIGATVLLHSHPVTSVALSCLPIIIPIENSLLNSNILNIEIKNSINKLISINSINLSFAIFEFFSGDIVNGFIHVIMSSVGFYICRLDGIVMLPSYTMSCTIFSAVSLLNVIELLLYGTPVAAGLPLSSAFIRLAVCCHPVLYAACAYLSWNLIEELRTGLIQGVSGEVVGGPVLVEPTPPVVRAEPFTGRSFRLNQPEHEEIFDN
jgi:hypothetical protein